MAGPKGHRQRIPGRSRFRPPGTPKSHRTRAAEIRNPQGGILLRLEPLFICTERKHEQTRAQQRRAPSSDRIEIPTHPHLCAVHTCTASPASLTGQRLSLFAPRLVPSYTHDSHHSMHRRGSSDAPSRHLAAAQRCWPAIISLFSLRGRFNTIQGATEGIIRHDFGLLNLLS